MWILTIICVFFTGIMICFHAGTAVSFHDHGNISACHQPRTLANPPNYFGIPHNRSSGTIVTKEGEDVYLEPTEQHKTKTPEPKYRYRLSLGDNRQHIRKFDYISSSGPRIRNSPRVRRKSVNRTRRDAEAVYIDVLVYVENRLYMRWYNESSLHDEHLRKEETLANIKQYYAFVINVVDARYKSYSPRMNIRLVGYIIESEGERAWLTDVRANETSEYQELHRLNGDSVQWSAVRSLKSNTSNLPPHDHLMIFTDYDLYYDVQGNRGDLIGIAILGVLCSIPELSVSVIEDRGGIVLTTETSTHELAHGLGVNHDGDNNNCRSDDRYIMADGVGYTTTDDNFYNPFLFSPCSQQELTEYIDIQLNNSDGPRSCMTGKIGPGVFTGNYTWPGQLYSADDQCKMLLGSQSSLCEVVYDGNFTSICHQLLCLDTQGRCLVNFAADGTDCDTNKWCMSGRCVKAAEPDTGQPVTTQHHPLSSVSEHFLYNTTISSQASSSLTSMQTQTPRLHQTSTSSSATSYQPLLSILSSSTATAEESSSAPESSPPSTPLTSPTSQAPPSSASFSFSTSILTSPLSKTSPTSSSTEPSMSYPFSNETSSTSSDPTPSATYSTPAPTSLSTSFTSSEANSTYPAGVAGMESSLILAIAGGASGAVLVVIFITVLICWRRSQLSKAGDRNGIQAKKGGSINNNAFVLNEFEITHGIRRTGHLNGGYGAHIIEVYQ